MKIVCPHCNEEIEIETPEVTRRGKLQGLSLEEMSDEQLKREITNAKSVLYKAKKRGADADIIAKNEDRVAAALAEKASRKGPEEKAEEKAEENAEENAEEKVESVAVAVDETAYNEY